MNKITYIASLATFLLLTAACGRQPAIAKVEVGQDVVVTKADGGVVEGKVASVDDTAVHVTAGERTKAIPTNQIVDVRTVDEAKPVSLPPAAKFREYTLPEGTILSLRLVTAINSGSARVEDTVEATLVEAVSAGGAEVLPVGSLVKGTVAAVESSGRVKGLASITVHFTDLAAAGRNDHYDIAATYVETASATKGKDAAKIGIGAGAGAVVGGLLGGKGGAVKGAAIGGGTGTAVVLSTKGDQVDRPVGARLTVRLKKDLDVRVPIG